MHPAFQAQVDAALSSFRQEALDAAKPLTDESTKIEFGRGDLKAQITGTDIVETKITDSRPVEGPKLGMNDKVSTAIPKGDARYSGKAGRG